MSRPRRTRRARRSLARRLAPYWLIVGFALALGGYGAYAVLTAHVFELHGVSVRGNGAVQRAEIVAAAALPRNRNVWLVDRRAVARRIDAIPAVKDARMTIRLPAAVTLSVAERMPAACVRDATGARVTVDVELRVLASGCPSALAPIYDLRAELDDPPGTFLRTPELLALVADARTLGDRDRYRAFAHDAYGDLDATLASGVLVRYGDDGALPQKQRLVTPILSQLGERAALVRTLDLRAPDTPVVEYRVPAPRPTGRRGRRETSVMHTI